MRLLPLARRPGRGGARRLETKPSRPPDEQLREIGRTIDGKITPLLNREQQAKYKQMQEERRRKMIEKMGNEAIEKAEEEIRKVW